MVCVQHQKVASDYEFEVIKNVKMFSCGCQTENKKGQVGTGTFPSGKLVYL